MITISFKIILTSWTKIFRWVVPTEKKRLEQQFELHNSQVPKTSTQKHIEMMCFILCFLHINYSKWIFVITRMNIHSQGENKDIERRIYIHKHILHHVPFSILMGKHNQIFISLYYWVLFTLFIYFLFTI